MDPLKRSPAKKPKPTQTADNDKPYQVVGELTTKPCGDTWCDGFLLEKVTARGVIWYSCNNNVQGDPNSCPFTANKFRPERDSTKKKTKLLCVICILPVNGAVSIGKKIDGELDDDGKPKYENLHVHFDDCVGRRVRNASGVEVLTSGTAATEDLIGEYCICHSDTHTFDNLRDGCTGAIESDQLIVKRWANADTPEPLHLRCAKRLWEKKRQELVDEKIFLRKTGTSAESEAKNPSALVASDYDDF